MSCRGTALRVGQGVGSRVLLSGGAYLARYICTVEFEDVERFGRSENFVFRHIDGLKKLLRELNVYELKVMWGWIGAKVQEEGDVCA